MSQVIEIFKMRSYQRPVREAFRAGKKRMLCLWHRRAGKDRNALAFVFEQMLTRTGVYFHIFPSLNQGRRDLWENIIQERLPDGRELSMKMIDIFPKQLIKRRDQTEMLIELKTGSIYQIMGADSDEAVDRLRGPNPVGLIFSEYAHGTKMKKAWDTLSPVLAENGGWALFIYTPNGTNHGEELYNAVKDNPHWFVSKMTIEDTRRDAEGENGAPVVTLETIERERAEGKREEFIQQEYYCSFEGFLRGTIYGDLMSKAAEEKRIGVFPHINVLPVGVAFDLGHSDAMACWFYQRQNNVTTFIDYWEKTQADMAEWVHLARERKRYLYGRVILPWDGRGQANYLSALGFRNIFVCDRTSSVQSDIETVRRAFPTMRFSDSCGLGLNALRNYKRKWDEDKGIFSLQPVHDKSSHGADALRTGVIGGFDPVELFYNQHKPVTVESEFDPRGPAWWS